MESEPEVDPAGSGGSSGGSSGVSTGSRGCTSTAEALAALDPLAGWEPFARACSRRRRRCVCTHQATRKTTETTETPEGGGDAAAGKQVFESAGCVSCHTLSDAGATGTVGPNLDQAQPPAELVVERVTNGQGVMPPFKDSLTEQQIQDVAAYVSSVAG